MPDRRAVIERPPKNRPILHANEEPVRIVNFRAEVDRLGMSILPEPEHARERNEAEKWHWLSDKKATLNLCNRLFAWGDFKGVRAGHTWAIQKGHDAERPRIRLRPLQPERLKIRELLTLR